MSVNAATQSLDSIVDVQVLVSPLAAPRATFNQMLIVGPSTHISGTTKIKKYTNPAQMLTDGFTTSDPEYLAAVIHMSQSPAPLSFYVGRQDATAIRTITINAGGTGYVVGDTVTVVQSGASGGQYHVAGISTGGVVTSLTKIAGGTGYSVASSLATTTNSAAGANLTVNITVVGDTPLSALQDCRALNFDWYTCMCTEAVKADHLAIGAWVETALPPTIYGFTTSDAAVPAGIALNVFNALKAAGYKRVIGEYSTSTPYAIAAILGYAMGQNSGLANSAFTLKFKNQVGVVTENLDPTAISNIESDNGNVYLSYGNYYKIFEQGVMANGQFFDEIINLDMLASGIQLNVMDLLYQNPKVPQTDAGVNQIIHATNKACEQAATIGFLGEGIWTGANILNLATGDPLPKGYLVQAPPVSSQSDADRQARKSPPIYVAIKEAGAVHSILIGVYVNR